MGPFTGPISKLYVDPLHVNHFWVQWIVLAWLPGRDSNPQPSGYENSRYFYRARTISSPRCRRGAGRFQDLLVWGSSFLSLCTSLPTTASSAGFAQDYLTLPQ